MSLPKTKKKTNITISQLKKKADTVFAKYIRYRDSELTPMGWVGRCITCDHYYPFSQIQCGHFQSRRFNSTRFDEENCNGQCVGCNVFRYGEQYKYAKNLDLKYGVGTADKLAEKAKAVHKLTRDELLEIIQSSTEQIKEYEGGLHDRK
jgi:hypothetical protein